MYIKKKYIKKCKIYIKITSWPPTAEQHKSPCLILVCF